MVVCVILWAKTTHTLVVLNLSHIETLNALDAKDIVVFFKEPALVFIYLLPWKKLSAVVPDEYVTVPSSAIKLYLVE